MTSSRVTALRTIRFEMRSPQDEHLFRSRLSLCNLHVSLNGLVKPIGFGLRNTQIAALETFAQMIHHGSDLRPRELLCIDTNQMKFVVIEVGQIQLDFSISTSRIGDRNLPSANSKRT